jgi:hypothetical protein
MLFKLNPFGVVITLFFLFKLKTFGVVCIEHWLLIIQSRPYMFATSAVPRLLISVTAFFIKSSIPITPSSPLP